MCRSPLALMGEQGLVLFPSKSAQAHQSIAKCSPTNLISVFLYCPDVPLTVLPRHVSISVFLPLYLGHLSFWKLPRHVSLFPQSGCFSLSALPMWLFPCLLCECLSLHCPGSYLLHNRYMPISQDNHTGAIQTPSLPPVISVSMTCQPPRKSPTYTLNTILLIC